MVMQGANADELDALATQMQTGARMLERAAKSITSQLQASPWEGRRAQAFRAEWNRSHRVSLLRTAAEVAEAANVLRRNAAQQREASVSESGVAVGPSPSRPLQGTPPVLQGSSPNLQGPGAVQVTPPVDLRDPEPVLDAHTEMRRLDGPLFVGDPDWRTVTQGLIGDCFFVAAIAGLAESDPAAIRDMIHDNGDGTVTVSFAGGRAVTVDNEVFVDAVGRPIYGQVGSDGSTWFPLIEKAYADLRGGYDDLNKGGSSAAGVEDLLGFSSPLSTRTYGPDFTWQVLSGQAENGRPVVVGTGAHPANDALVPSHAYMVQDVYERADGSRFVKLFNPHGSNTTPGMFTRFDMPYEQFLENFTQLSVPAGDLEAAHALPNNVA